MGLDGAKKHLASDGLARLATLIFAHLNRLCRS